jgi:hypothetical protein
MEHDTGANEGHHKGTKVAARLTQKKYETFEIQTAIRLVEFLVIDLAIEEINGRPLWEYFDGYFEDKEEDTPVAPPKKDVIWTGGARITVEMDDDNELQYFIHSRMKAADSVVWDDDVVQFVYGLQDLVSNWIPEVTVLTEHKRSGHIFRANPNFRSEGTAWRDWVKIDWGEEYGHLPAEIWGFVVLDSLPDVGNSEEELNYGGIQLRNGTYAIVESSFVSKNQSERSMSDIFIPFHKEVGSISKNGVVTSRKFYLADVEAFVSPICVVPDIGAKPGNKYLQVKPRSEWVEEFIAWIEDPHEDDDISD